MKAKKSRSILGVSKLREQINAIDKDIDRLQKQRKKTIKSLQSRCKHPATQIREAPYYSSGYGYSEPPFRVCIDCGYAEEGWHCGYWHLRGSEDVAEMSRDKARKYVLKFYTQEQLSDLRFRQ